MTLADYSLTAFTLLNGARFVAYLPRLDEAAVARQPPACIGVKGTAPARGHSGRPWDVPRGRTAQFIKSQIWGSFPATRDKIGEAVC
jgi:hypothetical protein